MPALRGAALPTGMAPSKPPPFIPSWLDDLGLSPQEFRVYCRIARRGLCFESIPSLSHSLHLNHKTIRDALKSLTQKQLILASTNPGKPTSYTLTTPTIMSGGTPTKRSALRLLLLRKENTVQYPL